jgi:ribonuclease G
METRILFNIGSKETRIAVLEEENLVELYFERQDLARNVGDIYKGVVTSVAPSLRAAFLNLGLSRNAFLPLSDLRQGVLDDSGNLLSLPTKHKGKKGGRSGGAPLQEGQEILVQIVREPLGKKGARITSYLSIPGRFLVLMPNVDHIGISRRIQDRRERTRLRGIAEEIRSPSLTERWLGKGNSEKKVGWIIRTEALGKSEGDFKRDAMSLLKIWQRIQKDFSKKTAPALIHKEVGLMGRLIRDIFTTNVKDLIIDSKDDFKKIQSYLKAAAPRFRTKVKLYDGDLSLFDKYKVESQIGRIFQRKIPLASGGYILIESTEALVAIDVNSGRSAKEMEHSKMVLQTNLEAAREIAAQLRLRDTGGLVVIDFIDMENHGDRRRVVTDLRDVFKKDKARTKILRVSELGLVEMTRQRRSEGHSQTFSSVCPSCEGTGRVLSKSTLSMNLERWLKRAEGSLKGKEIQIRTHPEMADYLSKEILDFLSKMSRKSKIGIDLKGDPYVRMDEFHVFSLESNQEITKKFNS